MGVVASVITALRPHAEDLLAHEAIEGCDRRQRFDELDLRDDP